MKKRYYGQDVATNTGPHPEPDNPMPETMYIEMGKRLFNASVVKGGTEYKRADSMNSFAYNILLKKLGDEQIRSLKMDNALKRIINHGMPMHGATQATWRQAFMSVDSIARKAIKETEGKL